MPLEQHSGHVRVGGVCSLEVNGMARREIGERGRVSRHGYDCGAGSAKRLRHAPPEAAAGAYDDGGLAANSVISFLSLCRAMVVVGAADRARLPDHQRRLL
jgi:hypothetical protein